jgi:hypothetical protein
MNQSYLVNATTIEAYWAHGLLYLTASGHAECVEYVAISQTALTIIPAEYQITTCACPQIGSFPYQVHAWFHVVEKPEKVKVHTASGSEDVEVQGFPTEIGDITTPAALGADLADGEVIGIAPNSTDINRAIADAVTQLQKLYPGKVNATLTETGVVAAGSPIGIAFIYVRMKQTPEKASKKKSSS